MKEIEKRDSVLTPKQQIDRLLRPGSTYFNLNPFEVLQIDPETSSEDAKKKYKRLSLLVHPDKNQDDAERAQAAFESMTLTALMGHSKNVDQLSLNFTCFL